MDNLTYWKNKWEEVGKDYILNKNTTNENIEVWDNSSKNYDETVGNERIEKVISKLENIGYINEDSIVLDLGCGTGAYSIPLSGICKSVDALDYSDGMLEILKTKIESENIKNINILKKDWKSINLKEENMYKKYDFIICSLNPGCYDYNNLLKMNEASNGYCCYIATNGKSKNEILSKADEIILGEKVKGSDISNVIYPFNILYFSGYNPEITYVKCNWTYNMDKETAINKLLKRYNEHMCIDENIKNKINEFVDNNLNNKVLTETNENTLGVITWNVN